MPSLKITYFGIKGRAEPIRLALSIGKVPFEDKRIKFDEWKDLKPSTIYGSLPELEVDGEAFAESNAMLRYAGKLGGLYPSDPLQALRVDQYIDAIETLRNAIAATMKTKDEAEKMEMRKKLADETIPLWFGRFAKSIKDNSSKSGFLYGNSVTIADLSLYAVAGWISSGILDGIPPTVLDQFEELMRLQELVKAIPEVAEFEAKHA